VHPVLDSVGAAVPPVFMPFRPPTDFVVVVSCLDFAFTELHTPAVWTWIDY
jgi:hypothetical protein